MRIRTSLAAILLVLAMGSAQAMSVTWSFKNAIFNDGTSLKGSFDYDNDRIGPRGYSNVDLVTETRGLMDGRNYTSVTPFSAGIGFTSTVGDQILGILFDEWIGRGGNPGSEINTLGVELKLGLQPALAASTDLGGGILDRIVGGRYLQSGSLVRGAVALREPATILLFAIGIIGIVALRRKHVI